MESFVFDEETVNRKLTQIFVNKSDREAARMLIDEIVGDSGIAGRFRIQLCVLKNAGADLGLVRHYVDVAHRDCRDVIAWAQYPEQINRKHGTLSTADHKQVLRRDEQQFQDWLDA